MNPVHAALSLGWVTGYLAALALWGCAGWPACAASRKAPLTRAAGNRRRSLQLPRGGAERRHFGPRSIHDRKVQREYWLFATGQGIISRRSKDLLNWTSGRVSLRSRLGGSRKRCQGVEAISGRPMCSSSMDGTCFTIRFRRGARTPPPSVLVTNPTLDPADANYGGPTRASSSNRESAMVSMPSTRAWPKTRTAACGWPSVRSGVASS